MFQIPQRQYWSCMGETVLKKSQYDKDAAEARANNRSTADQMVMQNTKEQNAFILPKTFISQMPQPQTAPPPQPRLLILLGQFISQPLQMAQDLLKNLQQSLTQLVALTGQNTQRMPGFMEKAMGQMLSFFFGNKKDAGRDNRDEKEMRERNEEGMLDIFGESPTGTNKVEQKANTGLGSGSR